MVQAWSPHFDPLKSEIETTPVWVRLSNIPVNFYHKAILMGIAKGLGKPVRVDATTLNFERARFARVCVEVNLKKSLKGSVLINGERYFVSYEGLTNICSLCGLYGHLVHSCSKRVHENVIPPASQGNPGPARGNAIVPVGESFTQIRRGRRQPEEVENHVRSGNQARDLRKERDSPNIVLANRFGNLEDNTESCETREVMVFNEESGGTQSREIGGLLQNNGGSSDKENFDPLSGVKQGKSIGAKNGLIFGS